MSDLSQAWLADVFGTGASILNWNSVSAISGTLTGIAAGGPIFAFRNSGSNIAWFARLSVAFVTTTAFTAPQSVDLGLFACRSVTVSDTGGTAITLPGGNNCRLRTSQVPFSACDIRIAASTALTAGTRTLDTNPVAVATGWSGAVGQTIPMTSMFLRQPGDFPCYPLVFASGEGVELQLLTSMGAAGAGRLYIVAEIVEVIGPSWPV